MNRKHRIWAMIGLCLIVLSVVCMIVCGLTSVYRDLMLQISLLAFLCALAILVFLTVIRKRGEQQEQSDQSEE